MLKVDRINDNTLRVRMDAAELKKRGMDKLDLLGHKQDIQKFFYSILEEVDTDHVFADGGPVSFQVMPSNDGLELLISKVGSNGAGALNELEAEGAGSGSLGDLFSSLAKRDQAETEQFGDERQRVFAFANFDAVLGLADSLRAQGLASSLYVDGGRYYLELAFLDDYVELCPKDAWLIAGEFGEAVQKRDFEEVKRAGRCLLVNDALANLRHYLALAENN